MSRSLCLLSYVGAYVWKCPSCLHVLRNKPRLSAVGSSCGHKRLKVEYLDVQGEKNSTRWGCFPTFRSWPLNVWLIALQHHTLDVSCGGNIRRYNCLMSPLVPSSRAPPPPPARGLVDQCLNPSSAWMAPPPGRLLPPRGSGPPRPCSSRRRPGAP